MKIPALKKMIRVAKKSNHQHRHCTLILKGGAPIAIGYNHDGVHSEINAIKKLWPDKRRGVTIINLRITGSGRIGISKPCEDCLKFLLSQYVSKIWYTDEHGSWCEI